MHDYNSIPFRNRDIDKLKKKAKKQKAKYSKALDEGKTKKAKRIEKRAVKTTKKYFDLKSKEIDSM